MFILSKNNEKTKISMSVLFAFSIMFSLVFPVGTVLSTDGNNLNSANLIETEISNADITATPDSSDSKEDGIVESNTKTIFAEENEKDVVTGEAVIKEESETSDNNAIILDVTNENVVDENIPDNTETITEEIEETVTQEEFKSSDDNSTTSSLSSSFSSVSVIQHTCALPNSLGDSTVEPVVLGWDSLSLQDVFNQKNINKNVISDQKQYQTWNAPNSTTTVSVEYVNKISALNHVFGYYRNGNISSFVPLFKSGPVAGFSTVPEFSFGQSTTFDVVGSGDIGFAIKASNENSYASLNSLNENNDDHAVVYELDSNIYIISFEDLPINSSDRDYNDITVKLTIAGCQNLPPNPPDPIPLNINIVASKIVCNSESDLPNWGAGGSNITVTTASEFLSLHPNCHPEPNWKFQWASTTATDPGPAFIGEAGGWNTFGSTNQQGIATTTISVLSTATHIWVREVLKDSYLSFTHPIAENNSYSAEMYCHTDVKNYDNYDRVDGPFASGDTYYCVAFNVPSSINQCVIDIVSDTSNRITGGGFAVATYSQHPDWTASIPGASWIWRTFFVQNPLQDETETFTKTFNITSTLTLNSASLVVAADNSYSVSVNGAQAGVDNTSVNFLDENKDTYDIAPYLHNGLNTISFTVKNWGFEGATAEINPAGLLYKLSIRTHDVNCNGNTPPTITLIGANPLNLTVGNAFTDPGATATDTEDGNLTSHIVKTGTVNASTTGTYILTYSVTDSGGLSASTTRTVVVNPVNPPNIPSLTLTANPSTITVGDSSTISWNSQNTSSCGANWTTSTSTSGTQIVTPGSTTDYTMTCIGANGTTTATTTISVNPKTTPPSDGGGGGGIGGRRHPIVTGEILGVTSCLYLIDHLKIDWQNNPTEVLKLQSFLNVFEKENLSLTGIFNQETFKAVERFQLKYSKDILEPWGEKVTTGFVYILTKKKINEIYCNAIFPVTRAEQEEIDNFRNLGRDNSDTVTDRYDVTNSLQGSGAKSDILSGINVDDSLTVELEDGSAISDSITRNVAVSLFALPQKLFGNLLNDCGYVSLLLFLILIAIIIAIVRLFTKPGSSPNKFPATSTVKTDTEEKFPAKKESPVIILPGTLPDEEIVIENPEEEPEDVLVNVPDLRDNEITNPSASDANKQKPK